MKHSYKRKSQRKAQERCLEEGKPAKLTNGTKSGKPKKKQRKAQTQNSPLALLRQALPLSYYLSYFFSELAS
jgi:hypothetical protein